MTPRKYIRSIMERINWDSRLIAIKGPKGVGKSTLMLQYIRRNFGSDDRHVLYFSADTNYFSTHTIIEVAEKFAQIGGTHLFIDEIHKYSGWSREIKEIYDLYQNMHIVISGSSLIQLSDGDADLSRRMISYDMPGLSLREYIRFEADIDIEPITLEELLAEPNKYCRYVNSLCHPLEHIRNYWQYGYYPFFFEDKKLYDTRIENVVNYTVDVELVKYRGLEVGNTQAVKALLQVISQMTPYEVDITKLSRATGISRITTLKYLRYLEEAHLIHRQFTDIKTITDLQKPDKILMDNSNLLYTLCPSTPETGTVRETFLANQLASAGHTVEYAGYKSGDIRIDKEYTVEVGGADKGFSQLKETEQGYVAADDITSAIGKKIPLWAFGMLY